VRALKALVAVLVLLVAVAARGQQARAANDDTLPPDMDGHVYVPPGIPTELKLRLGYTQLFGSGSRRTAEYRAYRSSPAAEVELRALPYPHRTHLDLRFDNRDSYAFNGSYALTDLVQVRWVTEQVPHQLDPVTLVGESTAGRFRVEQSTAHDKPFVAAGLHSARLRFKLPDFPLHVYVEGFASGLHGQRNVRFLGDNGAWDDLVRVQQGRQVDWLTLNGMVGLNLHLGPLELDYAHRERFFSAGPLELERSGVMPYVGHGERPGAVEYLPPGRDEAVHVATHADTRGRSDMLRVHSAYTGRIVAAAGIGQSTSENLASATAVGRTFGDATVTLIPIAPLTLSGAYRFAVDHANSPTAQPIEQPLLATPAETMPNHLIERQAQTGSVKARYRASDAVAVVALLERNAVTRGYADQWLVPRRTLLDRGKLAIDVRVGSTLELGASVARRQIRAPANNVEDEVTTIGAVLGRWSVARGTRLQAGYELERGYGHELRYAVADAPSPAGSRDFTRHNAHAALTAALSQEVVVSVFGAYLATNTEQVILFDDFASPGWITDPRALYRTDMRVVGGDVAVRAPGGARLGIRGVATRGMSNLTPSVSAAVTPVPIGAATNEAVLTTRAEAYAEVDAFGFVAALTARRESLRTDGDASANLNASGLVHIIYLNLSREW